MFARITGTGYYVPEKILDNAFFESLDLIDPKTGKRGFRTTNEWILKNMGVLERRKASDDEYSSDLAFEASKKALENSGIGVDDLEGIICGTVTPDRRFPSTACVLANKLDAKNVNVAFDISAACCGFVNALDIAKMYVESQDSDKYFLVAAADTITKIVDYENVNCPLFGDGSGAAVLGRSEEPGIAAYYHDCDATDGKCYSVYIGAGEFVSEGAELIEKGDGFRKGTLRMPNGGQVMRNATKEMIKACEYILGETEWKKEECFFVFHQANIRIINAIASRLKLNKDQYIVNIDRYGNMSGACSAIAFAEAIEQERIKEGDKVIFSTFGSGELAYGLGLIL